MRNLVLAALLISTLAACDNAAEESDEPGAPATTAVATETAVDSTAGTYEVTMPDGTRVTSVLNPDGTYQDTDAAGAESESGTWADRDGKTCFTPASGEAETCYTLGEPQADGARIATPADGSAPLTVRKTS